MVLGPALILADAGVSDHEYPSVLTMGGPYPPLAPVPVPVPFSIAEIACATAEGGRTCPGAKLIVPSEFMDSPVGVGVDKFWAKNNANRAVGPPEADNAGCEIQRNFCSVNVLVDG